MNTTSPTPPTRALRVLVADDQVMNLRAAARVLRELGHSGVVVTDGEQALRALESQPFDLLLLDVNMPVLDGVNTLRQRRKKELEGARRVPILMLSGHDSPDELAHFQAQGADGHLAKPLDPSAFWSALKRLRLA